MFEMDQLLRWAADSIQGLRPRRISIFAALAEWKTDPEAAFVAELDQTDIGALLRLVLRIATDLGARRELARLLTQKASLTSDTNIEDAGIQRLREVVRGVREGSATTDPLAELQQELDQAALLLGHALREAEQRRSDLDDARARLLRAAATLSHDATAPGGP